MTILARSADHCTEHFRFQRQQSRVTREAEWENRAVMPEPWLKLIGEGFGLLMFLIAVWMVCR
jgi:hypothetical protein